MANALGQNPIYLDDFDPAIDIGSSLFGDSNAPIYLKRISWYGPAANTDTATVTNGAGSTIFDELCDTAKEGVTQQFDCWVRGIKIGVSGVTSGKLLILLG